MKYPGTGRKIRDSLLKIGAIEKDITFNLAGEKTYSNLEEFTMTIFRVPSDKIGPKNSPYFICRIKYSKNPQDVIIAISDKVPSAEAYYHAYVEFAEHLKKEGGKDERVRELEKFLEKEKTVVTLERHECSLIPCLTRLYPIEK